MLLFIHVQDSQGLSNNFDNITDNNLSIKLHSAWSESSAACPRPRDGHRNGEILARGAFATLQRRGPQARAHIWVVFTCKGAERDNWRGPKGRADEPIFVASDLKRQIRAISSRHRVFPMEPMHHTVVHCPTSNIAFQQTVLPPSRALALCTVARKSAKMTDFSKTGSRNMAETCAINFLTLVSYSISIVIVGLRRLLLPVLMWAGVDFKKFRSKPTKCRFCVFFSFLITHYRKNRTLRETIFGSLVERWVMYWYSLKHLLCSIYFADRWRCKCAIRTLPRKHVQVGKFEHTSLRHRTS